MSFSCSLSAFAIKSMIGCCENGTGGGLRRKISEGDLSIEAGSGLKNG